MERQAHAVLDLTSRQLKAKKIEQVLSLNHQSQPFKLLEIGCGSGGISHYFATQSSLQFEVDAVDIHDNRLVKDGYHFQLVHGTSLPCADETYDVVLTNHVIEHVGERAAQIEHLAEIRRVLKPGGVIYLAVPNRWQLVEPHYQLAFLSWLPKKMRTAYLKMSGRGTFYDCEPLELGELETMFNQSGLAFQNMFVPALKSMSVLEPQALGLMKFLLKLPESFLNRFNPIIPTLIYRAWKA